MPNGQDEQVVESPTWMGNIRYFFEQIDIDHMGPRGFDLASYDFVKSHYGAIYTHTLQPHGDMPPEPERKWSAARSQTFRNWVTAGFPMGTAPAPADTTYLARAAAAPARLRKNITEVMKYQKEVDALTTAFKGVMAKNPSDQSSYCFLAGIHGLPQAFCLHHENGYQPLASELYLKLFEDALRSVPGCENVTLPYWDIKTPIPALLKSPPFNSYVVPINLGGSFRTNYKSTRYDQATINQNLADNDVFGDLDTALNQSLWGESGDNPSGFQQFSISGHDGGHGRSATRCGGSRFPLTIRSSGSSIAISIVTGRRGSEIRRRDADRIQIDTGRKHRLVVGPLLCAQPLDDDFRCDDRELCGCQIRPTDGSTRDAAFENKVGSMAANRSFTVRRATPVSVQVKHIDRLNIPGTFQVTLLADGKPVARRTFFQPDEPRGAPPAARSLVSLGFRVPSDQILDRKLSSPST